MISRLLDNLSNYLAHRKGLLPIIGLVLIFINLLLAFIIPGSFLVTSNLFLHLGLIIAIFGLCWLGRFNSRIHHACPGYDQNAFKSISGRRIHCNTPLGDLYRVTDERSNRSFALTILPKAIVENPEAIKELETNSSFLQNISHPNLNKYLGVQKTCPTNLPARRLGRWTLPAQHPRANPP
jgi:hypothetical protein